ncbi:fumarylacetoacetate hydrolase family protein [Mycobacterium sp. 141]|uniref:fumarylacetoacetate hydrolase family protein n=1 Tax=Mycobacterium sp. 141 TaxID=1120797 RepID=UPI000363CE43|nr:fumarylacetoacetate hydrolase family protein [Mycobacterium sp. 141]
MTTDIDSILPADAGQAVLIGRLWDPEVGGPRVVTVTRSGVFDLSGDVGTVSDLVERDDRIDVIRRAQATSPAWHTGDVVAASLERDTTRPHFVAPIDLQTVKACGVTFVDSLLERVIEERSHGDPERANEMRALVTEALGGSLAELSPGSPEAERVKTVLQEQGLWSQYLEVGIGPDPEVFTKAPVLASVGLGAEIGIPRASGWNNPEPELVLVVTSTGETVGASLGNDVNLRDVEGRSALLLGKAKDNNASSAVGPFIRLFDGSFTLDTLRVEEITLEVTGPEGFRMEGNNSLSRISRSFEELIRATYGDHHQYPDGFALYTGTLFAPTVDRGEPGMGFTHHTGDVVRISSPHLGALVNPVGVAEELPRWTFGIRDLFRHLTALESERHATAIRHAQ